MKEMYMKRFKLMLYALLLAVVVAFGGLLIACNNEPEPEPVDETEVSVYYYDADDGEYLITLGKNSVVTLVTTEVNDMGEYTVSDSNVTLVFESVTYNATLSGDVLTVEFGAELGTLNFIKRIPYMVSFDACGGSSVSSMRVINGKVAKKPNDPVNGDLVFLGWYSDKEYTKPFVFEANPVSGDITLYARWVEPVFGQAEFNVKFNLGYDNAPEVEAKQTIGGKLYDVVTPERSGYTFEGWWFKTYNADLTNKEFSYRLTADTVFAANTTLYALWQSADVAQKLATPVVDVTSNGISWGSNVNARSYKVLVTDAEGNEVRKDDNYAQTNMNIDFPTLAEGKYFISVTAVSASGNANNDSEPAVRYYDNKALAPVSQFTVVEPSTLIYNPVEGAEKYLLDIKCGDEYHNHTQIDNGSSTSFNFINCMMKSTGIEFTVTAVATGKYQSVSETYYHKRPLGDVTGLRYSQDSETVTWNSVANAAGYTVTLSCANSEHSHNVTIDVGNKTNVCIKTYEGCDRNITVKVTPYTKGYNSPEPTEITISKTTLAAPGDIRIIGDELSWQGDEAATGYDVYVAGQTVSVDETSLDLSTLDNINWETSADYQIRVRAKNASKSSLWSDTVDARYYALYSSLSYNAGVVSWRRVIGAVKYNVRVNNENSAEVTDGTNSLAVKLTQAGENIIYVNFVDGTNITSSWAQIKVKAETVTFDLRGGEGDAPTQYYALGDKVTLPKTGFARTGYTFADWYTSPNGAEGFGARYTDEYFGDIGGLTLYANWKPNTYDITFENGVPPVGEEIGKATYRQPYKWPIPTNEDTSLVFAGWFSDSEGLEVRYTDDQGYSVNNWNIARNMTVYASWNSIFSFELLNNGTYRISKNTTYWTQHAPEDLTIPTTYREPGTTRNIKVTEIGSASFTYSTMLKTVRIPNSIKYIDTNGFNGSTNIERFIVYPVEGTTLPEYSSHEGVLYRDTIDDFGNVAKRSLWIYPRGKADVEYNIQAGTTDLPYRSLYYAKAVKIVIPKSVVILEGQAFYYCSSLTDVVFEDGGEVTEGGSVKPLAIEKQAFYSLSKLERIKIPARLASFNSEMFYSCSELRSIDVEANSDNYSTVSGMLTDGTETTILYCPIKAVVGKLEIPKGITIIGERAFASNTQITSIELPYYVVEIQDYAFNKCTNLTSVSFIADQADPFDLKIGEHAFDGCTKLATLDLTNGQVVEIGAYAFSGCTKLADVVFADEYEEDKALVIGDFAFNGCTGLLTISLPAYVNEIGDGVFGGCTKLAEIIVDDHNTYFTSYYGVLFNIDYTKMLFYPLGKTGEFTMPDTVEELSAMLFKGNTTLTAIVIGKNVKSIGAEAFMNCTALKSVTFAENGKDVELGASVFEGCTVLETVELNDRIKKIPDKAFYNDKAITEIVMPSYVTEIGDYAFYCLEKIESITIPATVHYIGYQAFYKCTSLATVEFLNEPEEEDEVTYATTLNFGTGSAGLADTFSYAEVQSVILPQRMSTIPPSMFANCASLKYVYIPNTVSTIGAKAFYWCTTLTDVEFEEGNTSNKLIVEKTYGTVAASSITGAFSGCSELRNINLPDRLETISSYMFYNCRGLRSITLPKSLQNKTDEDGKITTFAVQDNAFANCTNLVTVTFANGNDNDVTIGSKAFYYCSKLTTINLPKNLTNIKKFDDAGKDISNYYDIADVDAFYSCPVFSTINVEEGGKHYYSVDGILYYHDTVTDEDGEVIEEIREVVFCPTGRKTAVVIPYDVTSINGRAFAKSWDVTSFSFEATPDGEEEVELKINSGSEDYSAFYQFIGITSLALPDRLTYIGDYAFYKCSMLRTLTIGENSRLEHVGDYAFADCTGLSIIRVPATVTSIGAGAFYGCTRINTFTFEDGSVLTEIGNRAFADTAVTTIDIPDSVTKLGDYLFEGSNLTTIMLPASLSVFSSLTLAGCDGLTSVNLSDKNTNYYIKDSVIYNAAKTELILYPINKSDESYAILDTVNTISAGAFAGNTYLKSVTIPNTVSTIGMGAFYGCTNLQTAYFTPDDASAATSLAMGGTADTVGVFQDCSNLKKVNLPARTTRLGANAFADCSALDELTIHQDAAIQAINAGVFSNAGGGTLTLPNAVTTINENAFTGSLFTQVVMTGVTTINKNAFTGSGITSVVLPATVATIGESAFANCAELESVEIKLNTTKNLSITTATSATYSDTYGLKGTFANCPKLKTATIATNGVLPYHMFYKCNALEELTIKGGGSIQGYLCGTGTTTTVYYPNTTTVGSTSSASVQVGIQGLKKVNIDNTFTSIGNYAFNGCSNLGSHNPETCVDENCPGDSAHGFTIVDTGKDNALTTIGTYAFEATAIKSFVIPSSVTSLGNYAFRFNTALTSVTIPTKSFTEIPTYEFCGCTSLSTVTFVDEGKESERKLVTISTYAFYNCTSLKSFDLTGFTTVKDYAFEYSGLTSIVIPDTITSSTSDTATYYIFANCKDLKSVTIATNGSPFIAKCTFLNCTSLKTVTFTGDGSKLTTIGTQAFEGCTALTDIILPEGLTTIKANAFLNSGLNSIELSNSVSTIDGLSFAGCKNLRVTVKNGSAELTVSSDLKSLLSKDGKTLVLYLGNDDTYTIPDGIEEIGAYAFQHSSIKEVILSDEVKGIGEGAFSSCEQLGNVTFPASVTSIGAGAFMDCTSITDINIPVTVESIGKAAFAGCVNLENVTIAPSTNPLIIIAGTSTTDANRGTFAGCIKLTEVNLSVRPINTSATVAALPAYIFRDCAALETVNIHSSATSIGNYAFYNCAALQTVNVPDAVTSLGSYAFQNCVALDTMLLSSTGITTINSYTFNNSGLSTITLPEGLTSIGTYAFMDCKMLERISIPGTVKTINSAAFAGCVLLESVIFEEDDGVTGLGFAPGSTALSFVPTGSLTSRGVFGDCVSLKSVDLSTRCKIYNNATSTTASYLNYVANYLFADCTSLASVTLPEGIVSIGTGSFFNSGLTSFTIAPTVNQIGYSAFANCSDLVTVTVTPSDTKLGINNGTGITSLGYLGAFYNCTSLEEIELGNRPNVYNSLTGTNRYLPAYTFYNCTSLKHITMPSNITYIQGYAFYNCTSLESIELPSSLERIFQEAFRYSGLTTLNLPSAVQYIGESVFRDCTDLESIHLPTSLLYVLKYAFMDCTGLKSLYVPAGIAVIGNAAFAGCSGLESLEFEENSSPLGFMGGSGAEGEDRGVFADCTSLKQLDLSPIYVRRLSSWTSYTSSYSGMSLGWNYTINSAMPEYMFHGCTSLESVVLSDIMWFGGGYSGDKSYDDQTFGNCVNLKDVTFPKNVDFRLGDSSFVNCGFETLTLPSNIAGMGSDAFAGNKNLKKLIVEASSDCDYIRGFSGCENLEVVELPDELVGIAGRAFQNCVKLKTVNMPESLDYIESNAFQNTALESVTIPAGIRVYSDVFADCKQLKSVTIEGALNNLGWRVFQNCTALTSVTLKEGFDDVMNYMFAGCTALNSITLPSTVEYVSSYAFYGCTSLASVEFSSDPSVWYIGEYAFAGCTSLTSIVIPETVTEVHDYAFEGWTAAQTIYIETLTEAPEGWSQYWNYDSKQVDVTPEPEEGEEAGDPVYETRPDKVIAATVVWGYTRPTVTD